MPIGMIPIVNAQRTQTLVSILGPALILNYDSAFFTPGTGPDVAAIANQAPLGAPDLSSPTELQRPHAVTVDGPWDFTRADTQYSQGSTTAYVAANSSFTLWLYAKFDTSLNCQPIELSSGTPNSGIGIFVNGGTLYGRIAAVAGQQNLTFPAWTPNTDPHLFRVTADASGASFQVDEGAPATSAADCRNQNALTHVTFGGLVDQLFGQAHDGLVYQAVLSVGESTAQRELVTSFLQDRWE